MVFLKMDDSSCLISLSFASLVLIEASIAVMNSSSGMVFGIMVEVKLLEIHWLSLWLSRYSLRNYILLFQNKGFGIFYFIPL